MTEALGDIVVNGRTYRQVFQNKVTGLVAVPNRELMTLGEAYVQGKKGKIPLRVVDVRYCFKDLLEWGVKANDGILPSPERIISEGIREFDKKNPDARGLNLNGIIILDNKHYRTFKTDARGQDRKDIISFEDYLFALCRYEERQSLNADTLSIGRNKVLPYAYNF